MDDQEILLSVVATSRNDDHGANLKRRMQTFTNAFIAQCKRHDLRAELILVEWNPPADRPRLAQALKWPADPFPCDVRIIEVPHHLHQRFHCADALPLFQMIGKNVGIRRAKGRFILATNIDILFNDDLMRFLKEGKLEKGKLYRIDRTDVETDVPPDAPIEEQLDYCRSHHLRINVIGGTFATDAAGNFVVAENDVAAPESRIVPMGGVSQTEYADGKPFRWAGGDFYLSIKAPDDRPRCLLLELSPGPCLRDVPGEIEFLDGAQVVARGQVWERGVYSVALPLAPGQGRVFTVRSSTGGYYPAPKGDTRILDFCLHRMWWSETAPTQTPQCPEDAFTVLSSELVDGDIVSPSAGIRLEAGWYRGVVRLRKRRFRWANSGASLAVDAGERPGAGLVLWVDAGPEKGDHFRATLRISDEEEVLREVELSRRPRRILVPVPPGSSRKRLYFEVVRDGVLTGTDAVQAFRIFSCCWTDSPWRERLAADLLGAVSRVKHVARTVRARLTGELPQPVKPHTPRRIELTINNFTPPRLHTNACGDFTLMAREHWFEVGGYAELEMYSLHIDTLGVYAAHYAGLEEIVLPENMRAYHIEHSAGSGWTPEGEARLLERLRSKGIDVLTLDALYSMARAMSAQRSPRLFSAPGWGLAHESLPETRIGQQRCLRVA
jgi:hypothetical protein